MASRAAAYHLPVVDIKDHMILGGKSAGVVHRILRNSIFSRLYENPLVKAAPIAAPTEAAIA